MISLLLLFLTVSLWMPAEASEVRIDDATMRDRIRGGWIGQAVGCTYGMPTEFKWTGTPIPDSVAIPGAGPAFWQAYASKPNDDLYVDMTFLTALDSLGLDVSAEALGRRLAEAPYRLWHGNQMARVNILNGVLPPDSGHYLNNPHADDLDFQIESDFIGLISPGMPASAAALADRVGHIMGHGDGVYGGVFVSAMYTHAFLENDVATVVQRGLESLPEQSGYARCIRDVLGWWRQWPDDWYRCWEALEAAWADKEGCPECVIRPCSIDAKLNGAYIAMGLLYGAGDFDRTVEIATRCGQDSDCNPSNAAGILGTILGFSGIPDRWKDGLDEVEAARLEGTDYSLREAGEVTLKLAAERVRRGGGKVDESGWTIVTQAYVAQKEAEVSFEGLTPSRREDLEGFPLEDVFRTTFEGRGFTLHSRMKGYRGKAICEVRVDGRLTEVVTLHGDLQRHHFPLCWNYRLSPGTHVLEVRRTGGDGIPTLHDFILYE